MSQDPRILATRLVGLLAAALAAATPAFAGGLASPGCSAGEFDLAQATNPCDPLIDVFTTVGDFTEFTFGEGGVPAIPAGFFFPGSQPFSGAVALFGASPGGRGDTALRRSSTPRPQGSQYPQNAAPVQVEVIGLSLSSIEPLQVTGADGQVQEWLMAVNLSGKQPAGELNARFDSPVGGASSCKLPVVPVLTFIQVSDSADKVEVRTLDFAAQGFPPIVLNTVETPFSTVRPSWDPCTGRTFFPGILPGGGDSVIVSTGPPFIPVRHVVEPPKPKKRCDYRHSSSTASVNPPCLPACPAGQPPHKGPVCNVVADCPPAWVTLVNCTTQGTCTEVHNVVGCS